MGINELMSILNILPFRTTPAHTVGSDTQLFADSRYSPSGLEELDNEQLLKYYDEVKQELTSIQLENYVLEDFLAKNDPKLLIGVTNALQVSQKAQRIHFAGISIGGDPSHTEDNTYHNRTRSTDRSSFSTNLEDSSSIRTVTSFSRRTGTSLRTIDSARSPEIRINLNTKIEIADKLHDEINQRLKAQETQTVNETKEMVASISEIKMTHDEVTETRKAFQKFVNMNTLDQINSRIPAEKYIRFIDEWCKNGMALVGKARLRLTALRQQLRTQRSLLTKKADLSVILRPIDFERLQIEKGEFVREIEEKNKHLMILKREAGHAAMLRNQNVKRLKQTENNYNRLVSEALAIEEHISRLEKEGNLVHNDLVSCEKNIDKLQKDIDQYAAPPTLDYAKHKHELTCLEKQKKLLKREMYLLNIKLANVKVKRRTSEDI